MTEDSRAHRQVVVLGGGRGLARTLQALRTSDTHLTVIPSIAAEGDSEDDTQRRLTGPVGDLRRSLEALSDEDEALLHAIRRPLTVDGVGRHPLGDLTLTAAADALGGYGRASVWLGDQLGIDGAVLPATIEPTRRRVEDVDLAAPDEAAERPRHSLRRLRFLDDRTESPPAAVAAIRGAGFVLLAPGGLYRHVLSTCAVPDLKAALRGTPARVVWIANLEPDPAETPSLTGIDHVLALHLHGVRVDAVLHDPAAGLAFNPSELDAIGVESIARPLRSASDSGAHDPERLHAALIQLLGV